MRVLVTGASGRIGGAIAARLSVRHQVTGFDLRPGPLTAVAGDLRDTARLAGLLAGVDAVVHTAALHVPDLAARTAQEFREVNVDATRRLLQACGEAGVTRFVYTSTTSLYGDAMLPQGAAVWVTEELAPRPRDVYDETKLAAEEACREASHAGLACVALRMSRCFPEHPRLVATYRLYRGVDAEDVAQAHELALAAPAGAFRVYNVSAPPPFRESDCARLLSDAAAVVQERLPWAAAEFARRGWQLPASIDRVYVVERAIMGLGYRPLHDFASLFRRAAPQPGPRGG
ncbi:MAG TPA: NAD(P)-dependent oxidoreductase [Steroidobacteraceae bacterium]|nr:NAD(P)-dependent oxidoreductase [Steroidobacteraceae bacterium]